MSWNQPSSAMEHGSGDKAAAAFQYMLVIGNGCGRGHSAQTRVDLGKKRPLQVFRQRQRLAVGLIAADNDSAFMAAEFVCQRLRCPADVGMMGQVLCSLHIWQ